ncbi:hypothetical protein Q31b_58770 [Novipirellula aureliae]|uniref:Uncharacterized protein n=1 Tax=Novipirellula aureliae TaxID=2527966 RepID=A0A5C6D8H1_9BACT|nr:hypothetical protein Q31b_58770 [Novipirellula aureliae]
MVLALQRRSIKLVLSEAVLVLVLDSSIVRSVGFEGNLQCLATGADVLQIYKQSFFVRSANDRGRSLSQSTQHRVDRDRTIEAVIEDWFRLRVRVPSLARLSTSTILWPNELHSIRGPGVERS